MSAPLFYDAHCHAFNLSHPSFLSFIGTLRSRRLETIYSQAMAPDFLVTTLFLRAGERIRNMLSVMENDIGSIFALMEDDLAGLYAKAGDGEPLLRGGELALGGMRFGGLVLAPLVMDFRSAGAERVHDAYYDRRPNKPVEAQVRDLLEGIRDYRRARPGGFLRILPFLGIDTRHYRAEGLRSLLDRSFGAYSRGSEAARASFDAMSDFGGAAVMGPDMPCRFAGIKVYPPLGFDPWPDREEGEGAEPWAEREKVEILYSYCELRGIPIVTHCDDQGFRVIGLEESWKRSSPERWVPVLERHPGLALDFGHLGARYFHRPGSPHPTDWVDRISRLMVERERVYGDFSFDGTEPEYYRWLVSYLKRHESGMRERMESRIMFGSDFPMCLMRIRSYADYFRVFAASEFPEEQKLRFCSENPERFLAGE
jgi:hypothetical protein